jgi:hypothetical protein
MKIPSTLLRNVPYVKKKYYKRYQLKSNAEGRKYGRLAETRISCTVSGRGS